MDYFRPRNWEKFQGYKKSGPAWIKLHSQILNDHEFIALTPYQQATLMKLWLLFARTGKPLPLDTRFIGAQLGQDCRGTGVALKVLLSSDFIELCDEDRRSTDAAQVVDRRSTGAPQAFHRRSTGAAHTGVISRDSIELGEETVANRRPRERHKKELEKDPPKGVPPTKPNGHDEEEISQVVAFWNAIPGLANIQRITEPRKRAAQLRLQELGGMQGWKDCCNRIRGSPFLMGENDRGWRADFDWILKPANLVKVMEGKYDEPSRADGYERTISEVVEGLNQSEARRIREGD